jgi:replicative DNA helicase
MLDPGAVAIAQGMLRPAELSCPSTRTIFEAACAIGARGERADLAAVVAELRRRGHLGVCGGPYGVSLVFDAVPVRMAIEDCCAMVHEHAERRRLWRLGLRLADRAMDWTVSIESSQTFLMTSARGEAARAR